jgi:hypothetical protein
MLTSMELARVLRYMKNLPDMNGQRCSVKSTVVRVENLGVMEKEEMLRLFTGYFNDVEPAFFEADLQEKEWAILLSNQQDGRLEGFSTIATICQECEGKPVKIVFSGDTVVERRSWGSNALPRAWASLVLPMLSREKERAIYWLLLCQGYRTYRFLPLYFRNFYPCAGTEMPSFEKKLLDQVLQLKYPTAYDAEKGLVHPRENHYHPGPLLEEVHRGKSRNRHIRFFLQANPGYARGDELACIAGIWGANFTPAFFRFLT